MADIRERFVYAAFIAARLRPRQTTYDSSSRWMLSRTNSARRITTKMWTDTQEYSTSLGKVLIQVCERSGDEPASRAAREAQDHSDGRRAKAVTKSSNIKGQSVSVEDSDSEIEEIEAPVAALPSSSNSLNIHYPDANTRERKAYKTPGGKTVPQHHWDVYDFTRTIPKGKVVTYKVLLAQLHIPFVVHFMSQDEPMGDADTIIFKGTSGEECDTFIRHIRRTAFERGKHKDYEWIAGFASCLYSGKALRWHSGLEDNVRENWKLLEQEMIKEFGVAEHEDDHLHRYPPSIGITDDDERSSRNFHSEDAETTTAGSPSSSLAPTPSPGSRALLRDPTGAKGVIQIALTGSASSQSGAAKAALNPRHTWYLGRDTKPDDGRLSLTNSLDDALRIEWMNQHVLKITSTATSSGWLGIRWMYEAGPNIALDSTHYAVLVCVGGTDVKQRTCAGSNVALGQISHTSWALAGRTYELKSKWERPVRDRRALGHMADLPAVLKLDDSRLCFLAGRPGDFFNTMGEDKYAVVRLVFHPNL
ncbi:hypothetical protein FRB90_006625 [Tulasnella sp. 427]|nr:hypothetical protein FRB90_006625 [Tulasnella sp. 427]